MRRLLEGLLFALQKTRVKIVLTMTVLAILAILGYLACKKGPEQYGNFLSLVGSLLMIIPPIRQALENGVFQIGAEPIPDELAALDDRIAKAKAKVFMRFSWADVGLYFFGALLLTVGFGVTIVLGNNK